MSTSRSTTKHGSQWFFAGPENCHLSDFPELFFLHVGCVETTLQPTQTPRGVGTPMAALSGWTSQWTFCRNGTFQAAPSQHQLPLVNPLVNPDQAVVKHSQTMPFKQFQQNSTNQSLFVLQHTEKNA